MTPLIWTLIPNTGIESGEIKISFGQDRKALNSIMSTKFVPPTDNGYPDEDDFLTHDKSTFIRVRYDGNVVKDIEFLGGHLSYQGINLHADTNFRQIQENFAKHKLSFRDTEWLGDGQDCAALGINIATRDDVGGDGDEIEWVILSSAFE